MLRSVDLPRTGRPEQDNELAREEIEIGTRKGVHLDLPIAIGLREALGTEYGLGHLLPARLGNTRTT